MSFILQDQDESDVGEEEEDEDKSGTAVNLENFHQIRSYVRNLHAFALSILFQIVDRTAAPNLLPGYMKSIGD